MKASGWISGPSCGVMRGSTNGGCARASGARSEGAAEGEVGAQRPAAARELPAGDGRGDAEPRTIGHVPRNGRVEKELRARARDPPPRWRVDGAHERVRGAPRARALAEKRQAAPREEDGQQAIAASA